MVTEDMHEQSYFSAATISRISSAPRRLGYQKLLRVRSGLAVGVDYDGGVRFIFATRGSAIGSGWAKGIQYSKRNSRLPGVRVETTDNAKRLSEGVYLRELCPIGLSFFRETIESTCNLRCGPEGLALRQHPFATAETGRELAVSGRPKPELHHIRMHAVKPPFAESGKLPSMFPSRRLCRLVFSWILKSCHRITAPYSLAYFSSSGCSSEYFSPSGKYMALITPERENYTSFGTAQLSLGRT